jgi:hypothetical protein
MKRKSKKPSRCDCSLGPSPGLGNSRASVNQREGCSAAPRARALIANDINIAQKQIASKTNEIPTAQPLLEPLDLKGKVITGDAMHTQTDLARFVVEKKQADYLFTVKDNQSTIKDDIQSLKLTDNFPP